MDGSSNTCETLICRVSRSISSIRASRSLPSPHRPSRRELSISRGWLTHKPTTWSIEGRGWERRIIMASGSPSSWKCSSLDRESSSRFCSSSSNTWEASSKTVVANMDFLQELPLWAAWILIAAAFCFSFSRRSLSRSSSSNRCLSRAASSILLTKRIWRRLSLSFPAALRNFRNRQSSWIFRTAFHNIRIRFIAAHRRQQLWTFVALADRCACLLLKRLRRIIRSIPFFNLVLSSKSFLCRNCSCTLKKKRWRIMALLFFCLRVICAITISWRNLSDSAWSCCKEWLFFDSRIDRDRDISSVACCIFSNSISNSVLLLRSISSNSLVCRACSSAFTERYMELSSPLLGDSASLSEFFAASSFICSRVFLAFILAILSLSLSEDDKRSPTPGATLFVVKSIFLWIMPPYFAMSAAWAASRVTNKGSSG